MKRVFIHLLVLSSFTGFAQEKNGVTYAQSKRKESDASFFLGTSTGINQHTGIIGLNFSYYPVENTSFDMGLGLSTWGWKFNIGGKYLFPKNHNSRFGLGFGFTHSTGLNRFTMSLKNINEEIEELTFNLKPVNCIHFEAYKMWYLGKNGNILFIDAGYSANISSDYVIQTGGTQASDLSISTLNSISPGGVIFGLGFQFALDNGKK